MVMKNIQMLVVGKSILMAHLSFLKTVILVIVYMCSMEHLTSQNMTFLFVKC